MFEGHADYSHQGREGREGRLALLRSVSVNLAELRRAPGAGDFAPRLRDPACAGDVWPSYAPNPLREGATKGARGGRFLISDFGMRKSESEKRKGN